MPVLRSKLYSPIIYEFVLFTLFDSIAVGYSIPVLSATLAFVTYTSTKTNFDVAVIFSSFTLFQVRARPHIRV